MSIHFQYAPYGLREGTWPARREEIGEIALSTLEAYAPGIGKLVVGRQVLSPLDLEQRLRADRRSSLPRRAEPRQLLRSGGHSSAAPAIGSPVEGLYLAGSGAHPGGGITGVPGQNAAREIVSDWKKRRR